MSRIATPATGVEKSRKALDRAVIRFAGDSGDGMQLTGEQFTTESAWAGNDLATLPNFPAEIRAPAGTLFGVSSFQLQFGSHRVYTPGDRLDCLVAMNPAALKVHLRDLKTGGLLVVNTQAFDKRNLDKAGYTANPLDDPGEGSSGAVILVVDISARKEMEEKLRRHDMTLIEIRRSVLGLEIQPVLGNCGAVQRRARETCRRIVGRLR